jgi:hypothetical protein
MTVDFYVILQSFNNAVFESGQKYLEFKHPVFEVIYFKRVFMGSILYSTQFVTRNGPVLYCPLRHYKLLSVPEEVSYIILEVTLQ